MKYSHRQVSNTVAIIYDVTAARCISVAKLADSGVWETTVNAMWFTCGLDGPRGKQAARTLDGLCYELEREVRYL